MLTEQVKVGPSAPSSEKNNKNTTSHFMSGENLQNSKSLFMIAVD